MDDIPLSSTVKFVCDTWSMMIQIHSKFHSNMSKYF